MSIQKAPGAGTSKPRCPAGTSTRAAAGQEPPGTPSWTRSGWRAAPANSSGSSTALYRKLRGTLCLQRRGRAVPRHGRQVHHADHDVYTVFSLWDTFRALHRSLTIPEPEMTNDFIRTMLLHYQDGGRLPVWELWGNETDCMIGYHSVSVMADAYLKGLRDYDADLALEAMVARCHGRGSLPGGLPKARATSAAGTALSVSNDSWNATTTTGASPQMARGNGPRQPGRVFHRRSGNWRNLFDPGTKFFRARRNGGFIGPSIPTGSELPFHGANAWQYSLFARRPVTNSPPAWGNGQPGSPAGQALHRVHRHHGPGPGGHHRTDRAVRARQRAQPPRAYLYSWLGSTTRPALPGPHPEQAVPGWPGRAERQRDCGQMSRVVCAERNGDVPDRAGR